MGRRSRTRARAATNAGPVKAKEPAAVSPPARRRLDPVRRTLAAYLAAALVLATLTLAGILLLGGTLGPFITLAVVAVGAGLVHRAATARLAAASLTGEDRMMQTMAGGMLVLSVVLAAAGAVVATLV
jgi:hypothetical protein